MSIKSSSKNLNKVDRTRTYSIEEYETLPDDGNIYELLEGKLILRPSGGDEHGSVAANLGTFLTVHVRACMLGKVWSNARFVIERKNNKDTELAPDVGFIAHPDVPPSSPGAVPIPPHLAVEVQSPGDSTTEIKDKVRKYQKAGVKLIWVVQSGKQIVAVYRQGESQPITIQPVGELDGENVVPGFKLPVRMLFE
jgi:Uma2 family endonuclease